MTTRNEAAERLLHKMQRLILPEPSGPLMVALARSFDEALYSERREMVLRIERALFARGWTLDQEDGPEADVRAVLDAEAAR